MAEETSGRLSLRGNELAAAATVKSQGDELFVELDKAPPVRAVLELESGGTTRRIQVLRVQRSAESGGPVGFFARYLDDEGSSNKVGSEHLDSHPDLVHQVVHADSGPDSYPVPAPVLEAEPSEAIDLREVEARERIESPSEVEDESSAPEEAAAEAKPRGKKRKGRKRG